MTSRSLRSRLFLSYLAVLLVGMSLAAVLAWLAVENLYLATQRENLLAQARLAAAALQGASLPSGPELPYSQVANLQPGLHTRLLDDQGGVVVSLPLPADSLVMPAPAAENSGLISPAELRQRPEIQLALQGQAAAAVRRVPSADNRRVLYAAAPILAEDGQVMGLAYLATPLPPAGLPASALLQLGGAMLAAVLLALAAGTWLAGSIARPVENVARAARAVSAGDLDQRVPAGGSVAELDSLGQAFNAMTDSLRQSERAKNAFIADVTHELRTPLTVIKGTIETLEDGALDDEDARGPMLAAMQRETDRLIRLVNDLLVLARADAGALKLDLQPLDLEELARARSAQLAPLAARRQVTLVTTVAAGAPAPLVLGDAYRLAQVLDNLLDNATRHTAAGSTVTVALQPAGLGWECSVSDQGPGIPAEHLPFIFNRFYRVDTSRNRHTGGAGLGLAIARALVVAQGGHITAHSAPGTGATLTFWLPSVPA